MGTGRRFRSIRQQLIRCVVVAAALAAAYYYLLPQLPLARAPHPRLSGRGARASAAASVAVAEKINDVDSPAQPSSPIADASPIDTPTPLGVGVGVGVAATQTTTTTTTTTPTTTGADPIHPLHNKLISLLAAHDAQVEAALTDDWRDEAPILYSDAPYRGNAIAVKGDIRGITPQFGGVSSIRMPPQRRGRARVVLTIYNGPDYQGSHTDGT
jgi:hypothetical protein